MPSSACKKKTPLELPVLFKPALAPGQPLRAASLNRCVRVGALGLERLPGLAQPLSPFTFFFFNDTATTEIYTLSLHDALPISPTARSGQARPAGRPPRG